MRYQPLGDQRLGMRVDGRGGIDQDQDLRVEPEHSCQNHPLSLAAGQSTTTLVDPALPTSVRTSEDILCRGDAEHRLGLGEAETSVRIDGRLQRACEDLTCTIGRASCRERVL